MSEVIGNPHQRAELAHIEQFAEALGWLVTSYSIKWGDMPNIQQIKGISEDGKPFSEVNIRS